MAVTGIEQSHLALFVEPDGGWALATGEGLRTRGWSVVWAADAATAVPAARQTLPDVVLVDAALAEGAEFVVQQLRASAVTALIPAIGLVENDAQEASLDRLGVQACLHKPIDVDALDAAARQVLGVEVAVHAPPTDALADPDRLALLRDSGLLDREADGIFDDLTALTTGLLPAQSARVTLVSDREQVFVSRTDRPGGDYERGTPLSHSLCQWPVACHEPLVVSDARVDPLLAMNRAVTDLGAVAYLGTPLIVDGHALGTLCVLDDQPREWDPDEFALLDDLATVAIAEIRLRLADGGRAGEGAPAAEAVGALARVLRRHGSALDEASSSAFSVVLEHFAAGLRRT